MMVHRVIRQGIAVGTLLKITRASLVPRGKLAPATVRRALNYYRTLGHFVLAPLNWFWRKDPASLKPFGQKGNSGGFCDTFPVIVFGQKLSPAGFVLLGGSTGGFLAMVRLL
jgi:hypothetical protein